MGQCTIHTTKCGAGIGCFFLLNKCTILLIRGSRSAYFSSPYVDEHGEVRLINLSCCAIFILEFAMVNYQQEDMGLVRGRPLYLSQPRYDKVKMLWKSHSVAKEVTRIRCDSERVIREDYY